MQPDVSLDLLKTFTTFASSENIVETARRLQLSQPTVSFQLKKLEDELPYPLFSVEGRKKVLSHFGRALYDTLRDRLSDVHRSLEEVTRIYSDPTQISLRIGARDELFSRIAVHLDLPCRLEFKGYTTGEAIERLLSHDIDIAVSHVRPDTPQLISRKLFSDIGKLVVHKSFLKGRSLTLDLARDPDFLLSNPCIVYKATRPPFFTEWSKHCDLELKDFKIRAVCEHWYASLRMVEMKMGYSIIPSQIQTHDESVVSVELPTDVCHQVDFYMLYHRDLKKLKLFQRKFQ